MIKSVKPCSTTGQNLVGLWRPSFTRVDQKLYLYGGGGHVTNDLHVLDLVTMNWDCVLVSKSFFLFVTVSVLPVHRTEQRTKRIDTKTALHLALILLHPQSTNKETREE